nr:olfactory receptor 54 [Gregopimpla kuwanae]
MLEGFDKAKDLIFWNRRLLSVVGLWPLESRPTLFYSWMTYSLLHLFLGFADLAQVFGNLNSMIGNLGETAYMVMVMAKIFVLRYSSVLRKFMKQVEFNNYEVGYKNEEERRIYMSYTNSGLRFFVIAIGWSAVTTTVYYLKALRFTFNSEQPEFPLPFRLRIFFNVTDIATYYLVYAYEGPVIYIYTCHGIIACFIWSLVLNVCGQLSVLSFRIKNMTSDVSKTNNRLESTIREIVQKHREIIWSSSVIDSAFKLALLVELVVCTVIMGLCMYNIIMNFDFAAINEFLAFFMYIFMMLLVMYGYCVAGDFLERESLNVQDSYFECDWYNMPLRCQKLILMCMIRAQIPLHITGGGFYVFKIESFTSIVKTAAAYGSMLRQVA